MIRYDCQSLISEFFIFVFLRYLASSLFGLCPVSLGALDWLEASPVLRQGSGFPSVPLIL